MTDKRMAKNEETILLIEDEPMLLELLKAVLEEEGYRIETAKNGEDAVALFRRQPDKIDLVLSDMGLPKMGGWDVFERLRELKPGLKMILASGYVDSATREDMISRGAQDVVQKPYVPHLILKRIRDILDAKT
ncbi:MAG TPA: response regulator [Bacteroidota bacterium]|nr:response regulator [Bacteroidota bacterium]